MSADVDVLKKQVMELQSQLAFQEDAVQSLIRLWRGNRLKYWCCNANWSCCASISWSKMKAVAEGRTAVQPMRLRHTIKRS